MRTGRRRKLRARESWSKSREGRREILALKKQQHTRI